jgi:hypothetical protein
MWGSHDCDNQTYHLWLSRLQRTVSPHTIQSAYSHWLSRGTAPAPDRGRTRIWLRRRAHLDAWCPLRLVTSSHWTQHDDSATDRKPHFLISAQCGHMQLTAANNLTHTITIIITNGTFLIIKIWIVFKMNVRMYFFLSPNNGCHDCTNWIPIIVWMIQVRLFWLLFACMFIFFLSFARTYLVFELLSKNVNKWIKQW